MKKLLLISLALLIPSFSIAATWPSGGGGNGVSTTSTTTFTATQSFNTLAVATGSVTAGAKMDVNGASLLRGAVYLSTNTNPSIQYSAALNGMLLSEGTNNGTYLNTDTWLNLINSNSATTGGAGTILNLTYAKTWTVNNSTGGTGGQANYYNMTGPFAWGGHANMTGQGDLGFVAGVHGTDQTGFAVVNNSTGSYGFHGFMSGTDSGDFMRFDGSVNGLDYVYPNIQAGTPPITGAFTGKWINAYNNTASGPISVWSMDYLGNTISTGSITANAGVGVAAMKVGGVLNTVTVSSAASAAATEQTLYTYSIPANTMNTVGSKILVHAGGHYAANGNNKEMRIYFGSSVLSNTVNAGSATSWQVDGVIVSTGTNAQVASGTYIGPSVIDGLRVSPVETTTAAIVTKVTGQQGSASADIILDWAYVEFKP